MLLPLSYWNPQPKHTLFCVFTKSTAAAVLGSRGYKGVGQSVEAELGAGRARVVAVIHHPVEQYGRALVVLEEHLYGPPSE